MEYKIAVLVIYAVGFTLCYLRGKYLGMKEGFKKGFDRGFDLGTKFTLDLVMESHALKDDIELPKLIDTLTTDVGIKPAEEKK